MSASQIDPFGIIKRRNLEGLRGELLVKCDVLDFENSVDRFPEPTRCVKDHSSFTVDTQQDFVCVPDHETVETPAALPWKSMANGYLGIQGVPSESYASGHAFHLNEIRVIGGTNHVLARSFSISIVGRATVRTRDALAIAPPCRVMKHHVDVGTPDGKSGPFPGPRDPKLPLLVHLVWAWRRGGNGDHTEVLTFRSPAVELGLPC